jgi:hypothetical protein
MKKPAASVSLLVLALVFALGAGASAGFAQPGQPDQPTAAPDEPVVAPVGTTPEPAPQAASCTSEESFFTTLSPVKSDKRCENACRTYCSHNGGTSAGSLWIPRTTDCDCYCCPDP